MASYHLSSEEVEALHRLSAALSLGRTLAELTAIFARQLAPLIDFASLMATVEGEPPVRVGSGGAPLEVDPTGSTTCVYAAKPVPGGGEVSITMRRQRRTPFARRDVIILDLAAPAFAWAVAGRSITSDLPPPPVASDAAGLLPASGSLLLGVDGKVLGSDGAGLRLARACCPPGSRATLPGALESTARELGAPGAAEWTRDITLPLRAGGLVRVRLARVGGKKTTIVAFLDIVSGSGAAAETPAMRAGLTRREREVADCAARGLTNPDIARLLGISVETVKQHMASIFAKTGAGSRKDLTHLGAPPA